MADQGQAPVAPVAPAPVKVWTENPNQGNFNPCTKHGEEIFKMKTKGLPNYKQLALQWDNAQTFFCILEAKDSTFGPVLTKVPVEFDITETLTRFSNMVQDYKIIPLEVIQRSAIK